MNNNFRAILFSLFSFLCLTSAAQAPGAAGFGGLHANPSTHVQEISEGQRKAIVQELQANVALLKARGVITANRVAAPVKFIHPLRKAAGFNEPGYYSISNYIDTNMYHAGAGGPIRDYNCGQRTYTGHYGTDYYLWPHPWKKMEENSVEIISAAAGVIIARQDGIEDKSCATCPENAPNSCFQWNAVYVQNTDGTVCWYGHMKKGSVTSKKVGDAVSQGEYLGVVGSSGNSTGPHLHFEVWQNNDYEVLIDPWKGTCNPERTESYWASQEQYYVPMVNAVTTASGMPTPISCYNNGEGEKPLLKDTFLLGETVYTPFYLRDHLTNRIMRMKLTMPSGTIKYNFTQNTGNQYYSSAYYYYSFPGNEINVAGDWKFSVEYGNNIVEHTFTVVDPLPLKLLNFTANKQGNTSILRWQTTNEENSKEFLVERSSDGLVYQSIGTVAATGSNLGSSTNSYSYNDGRVLSGSNYYRLKIIDMDGSFTYSAVALTDFNESTRFGISPNPASSVVYISGHNIQQVQVMDNAGRVVINTQVKNESVYQLNVSKLTKGLYIITIRSKEGKPRTEKLIIQ